MRKISVSRDYYTIIDDEDYSWLSQWKWYLSGSGYAVRHVSCEKGYHSVYMHRLILNLTSPNVLQTDHINGDRLDNRRCNLRAVTRSQNAQNRHKLNCSSSPRPLSMRMAEEENNKLEWLHRETGLGYSAIIRILLTKAILEDLIPDEVRERIKA